MARSPELPDYLRPPLEEVAIGVQFDRVRGFTDVHAGLFWQRVRASYPRTQSRPRVETPIEDLSTPTRPILMPSVQMVGADESIGNRTWLLSHDGSTLLQIQDNCFLRNWRRRSDEYPHLDPHADAFWSEFESFREMLERENLGTVAPSQLELTYFNWIAGSDATDFFVPAVRTSVALDGLAETPEEFSLLAGFLDAPDSKPCARVKVEMVAGFRSDVGETGEHGFRLVFSYRAPLTNPSSERMRELIERGRTVIDNSFTQLTTGEAHDRWGRVK